MIVREKKNVQIALQTKILAFLPDSCSTSSTPPAVVVFEAGLFFFRISFIEIENLQLLAHFSLDLDKFFFPDYQQTISRRLAKPEFASEASETSEMPFTFYTLKK